MAKQLSFPDIRETEDGYTTGSGGITVGDLKEILKKFPDEMSVAICYPSKDFSAITMTGAQWVGKQYIPMTEGTYCMSIHPLSPSAVKRNRDFYLECEKNKK